MSPVSAWILRALLAALAVVTVTQVGPSVSALEPESADAADGQRNGRWFGYNEDWFTHSDKVDFVARGGANVLRSVMSWRVIERRQGEYRWRRYDALYRQMLDSGTRPLWVLADAPCWAWAPTRRTCREEGRIAYPPDPAFDHDWARFVARVAQRYPEAVAIESWNEPNLGAFFRPAPDPRRTAELTAWANFAVDHVDPSIPVILGGPSPTFNTFPGREIAYGEFLRAVYAALGPGYWDGVAMHPFPSMRKQSHYLRDIHAHLNTVKAITRSAGAPGTPIWVTEVGLSTRGVRPYSQREQATGLRRIYARLSRRRDITIPAIIVHRLVDQPIGFGAPAEAGWGIVRRSGEPKRAFCELARERGRRCPTRTRAPTG